MDHIDRLMASMIVHRDRLLRGRQAVPRWSADVAVMVRTTKENRNEILQIGFALFAAAVAACGSAAAAERAVVTVAAVSPTAIASTGAPAGVEAAITTLERDWAAAIVKKDAAALGRLLADDFNGTSPTAHTFTKTVAIDDLKNGGMWWRPWCSMKSPSTSMATSRWRSPARRNPASTGAPTPAGTITLRSLGEKGRPMAGRCLSRLAVQRR